MKIVWYPYEYPDGHNISVQMGISNTLHLVIIVPLCQEEQRSFGYSCQYTNCPYIFGQRGTCYRRVKILYMALSIKKRRETHVNFYMPLNGGSCSCSKHSTFSPRNFPGP